MANNSRGSPNIVNISRRSKKLKNLEHEVELILSQDENEDDVQNSVSDDELPAPKTPTTSRNIKDVCTPDSVLQNMLQTPRRSCRKSIKPPQDYNDIIVRKCRSAKKDLVSLSEDIEENVENLEDPHKWSAAKVGRSSSKRTRKSKRTTRGKRIMDEDNAVASHEDAKNRNEADNDEEQKLQTETAGENHKEHFEKSDMNFSENKMENLHISSNNFKDIMETVRNQEMLLMMDETTSAETLENSYSNTQNKEVVDEQLEEEIHLIQDDSEDFKEELPVYSGKQEESTCKQVTKETSSEQVAEDCGSKQEAKEDTFEQETASNNFEQEANKNKVLESLGNKSPNAKDDSFGCYLKSKEIKFEDLGLNPINDEADEDATEDVKKVKIDTQENEEMPPLIVCDDEENGEVVQERSPDETTKLNETFDADDSVVFILDEATTYSTTSETVEMDALKMSDDESEYSQGSSAKKAPRIMLTNTEEQNQTLLSTPKQSIKPYRFPTPYRSRGDSKLKKENVESPNKTSTVGEKVNLNMTTSLTTMAPKDIILRGIRKRSLSVCLGSNDPNATYLTRSAKRIKAMGVRRAPIVQKMVNFYSPANQTAIIEDLDKLIAKNVKKIDPEIKRNQNVTTRRKRSLSLDESMMSKSLCISKLPRPVSNQTSFLNATTTIPSSSSSSSTSKPMRTKLPNFAAIHQKQFQKMENLIDHVTRKQERSKVLINSANKIRPASAQKNISMNVINKNTLNEKPKALKRIDMTAQSQIKNKSFNAPVTPKKIVNVQSKISDDKTTTSKLPDPRTMKLAVNSKIKSANKPKPPPKKHLKPTQSFNISSLSNSMANTAQKQKPVFNLSTHIGGKSTTSSSTSSANTSTFENRPLSTQDKMASRLQRHMDLFKGRVPAARAGVASRKNEAGIRGVRSNRRFELQMQHRRNIEN